MGLSFSDLRNLQLGGSSDNLSLAAIAAGVMASHPALASGHYGASVLLSAALAGAGGAAIGSRLFDRLGLDTIEGGGLRINSSAPPPPDPEGVHLGYIVDTGEPLIIPMEEWMRHAMVVGQSGVGKTVFGEWLMAQQIARGGGIVWIDGKLDPDNLATLWRLAAWAGRADDLRVISPGDPDISNTYNPILYGDPDEVASRAMSLIPDASNSAGADFYRQEAKQSLTIIVNALQATRMAYNFADLTVLLGNSDALTMLENMLPPGSDAQQQFSLFLHKFKMQQRGGFGQQASSQETIDVNRLKTTLGGIAGRMFEFGSGKFGRILNSYSPEVRLTEDIMANRIVYIALPTMGKNESASNFGKMATGDFRSAIASVQAMPKAQRPWPPTLGWFDEAGSYVTNAWGRMFEQSRAAQLMLAPAFQTRANLEVLGEELRAMVSGNTNVKAFFRPGEPDTAKWMADMIGEEFATRYSISGTKGTGASRSAHASTKPSGWNETGGQSFSESTELMHKITPTELMQLGKGEAIITFEGSKVYHVRIPRIALGEEFHPTSADQINRIRTSFTKGIDLHKKINELTGYGRARGGERQ